MELDQWETCCAMLRGFSITYQAIWLSHSLCSTASPYLSCLDTSTHYRIALGVHQRPRLVIIILSFIVVHVQYPDISDVKVMTSVFMSTVIDLSDIAARCLDILAGALISSTYKNFASFLLWNMKYSNFRIWTWEVQSLLKTEEIPNTYRRQNFSKWMPKITSNWR